LANIKPAILAKAKMAAEKPGQTIQATALVHDAYLRLVGNRKDAGTWNGRGHFFAAAAEAMRRILIDNARRKAAAKHGGDNAKPIELNSDLVGQADHHQRLLELNDAIEKLESQDQQKAELVKLKIFADFSTEDSAKALGISVATAFRWWEYCRAWLKVELG
jgi:RNA polymerase sigma factor (TIGR02999 family)